MNTDDSGLINITNDFSHDIRPCWLPDRMGLLFSSNRDGDYGIYVMRSEGSDILNLTNTSSPADEWVPDYYEP